MKNGACGAAPEVQREFIQTCGDRGSEEPAQRKSAAKDAGVEKRKKRHGPPPSARGIKKQEKHPTVETLLRYSTNWIHNEDNEESITT